MTTIRSISGIPDETWQAAKQEYPNVSKKIKQLIEKDLQIKDQEKDLKLDLLKNSELTKKQKKVAQSIISTGSIDKNSAQLGTVLSKHFSDSEYKQKCRNAIVESENVPFEADGYGIKGVDTVCKCGASNSVENLRRNDFECKQCGRRLYDI